ncbi:hypothetical protein F9Z44_05920 [Hydrogenophaga sp. PBL-H3]|nr:hypothetical protein F9Z45_05920 [Hydrogenophaga sp. PBL-H3]QHE82742.1 hypothetical protein F9Z44_05920 [Hydrogenophaga sp. PBL-H3]
MHALSTEEAVWLLGSLAGLHRKPFDVELLIKRFAPPWDLPTLIEALAGLGLKAQTVPWPDPAHPPPPFPVVAFARTAGQDSAGTPLLIASRSDGQLGLFRPGEAPSELDDLNDLHALSPEVQPWLLLCAAQDPATPAGPDEDGAASPGKRPAFGFAWFIPELLRHRRLWRDVLLASLAIQLVGLATPLFTQVIIDKVIAHHSVSTLWVLGLALVVFMLFTSTMSWLRQYLVLHTGSRMDAVLGEQVMRHLLRLPLPYFEARPTGTLVARLQGVDPPPPGHDTNLNDGAQTGTLQSGGDLRTTQILSDLASPQPVPFAPVDWSAWNARQATPPSAPEMASIHAGAQIERHWQQLFATLQQMDAERSANDLWSDSSLGTGHALAGLTAGGQQVDLAGASVIGLAVGSGTHLASFHGLKEGLASLAA